jgi:ABC-type sugar transport system ATPase subunit
LHIVDNEEQSHKVIKGRVRFTELLGADQNIHIELDKSPNPLILRAPTDIMLTEGELVTMRANMNRVLFYDMNSGSLVV